MWFQSAQGGAEGNEVQPCLSRPEACVQQLAFGGWWAGHLCGCLKADSPHCMEGFLTFSPFLPFCGLS